jgi:hypothetical protein
MEKGIYTDISLPVIIAGFIGLDYQNRGVSSHVCSNGCKNVEYYDNGNAFPSGIFSAPV